MHPNAARVREAARARGVDIEIREFAAGTRTAGDAARAIGCDVAQIVKSLVFVVDGEPVLALVSGANRVDEALLTSAVGGTRVSRADADRVREATGFPIGGVPPFGHPRQLRTCIDPDLLAFDVVWAAAGTPRHVFPAEPAWLASVTGATEAAITARPAAH
ncbi:MAG TPA: YbaK/EbsC family protein [Acidimicrobiales bacterium]